MRKRSKMPRDGNQLAKMIVDLATGTAPPEPAKPEKNAAAVALGSWAAPRAARRGRLSPAKRKAIA